MITAARARELLDYDFDTGVFAWRVARPKIQAGAVAGGVTDRGYRKIRVDGTKYRCARLAWLMVFGEWPLYEVDHIDGDKLNDRLGNLRDVSRLHNMRNQKMHTTNTSGVTGVSWHASTGKWAAYIGGGADKIQLQLGKHDCFATAVAARKTAEASLWGSGHDQQLGT